jgi:hypothetical protein
MPVAVGVSPTEAIRAQIHELFASGGELLSVVEQVARLSVRLTFQSVIEEIVCEELGRGRYQRRTGDLPEGYRNGWQQPRTLKTSLGPVQLQRPKLRHAHAALCDQLFGQGVTRTNALETLVISCWVRGLSDRDVQAMLTEVFGEQAAVSRTTVSRICQRLRAEFDTWKRRDLSKTRIDYLYLDGSFLQAAPKARAEPVLVAWGIDVDGKPVFLGLAPGAAESTDAWRGLLEDLKDRGLGAPAAGHLRRWQGAVRGDRVRVRGQPAPALPGPRLPQPHRQGPHPHPGRGEAGLLGDLRWDRAGRRGRRRPGPPASQAVHRQAEAVVPRGGRLRGRQPRHARGPPAVPGRAP